MWQESYNESLKISGYLSSNIHQIDTRHDNKHDGATSKNELTKSLDCKLIQSDGYMNQQFLGEKI